MFTPRHIGQFALFECLRVKASAVSVLNELIKVIVDSAVPERDPVMDAKIPIDGALGQSETMLGKEA